MQVDNPILQPHHPAYLSASARSDMSRATTLFFGLLAGAGEEAGFAGGTRDTMLLLLPLLLPVLLLERGYGL